MSIFKSLFKKKPAADPEAEAAFEQFVDLLIKNTIKRLDQLEGATPEERKDMAEKLQFMRDHPEIWKAALNQTESVENLSKTLDALMPPSSKKKAG